MASIMLADLEEAVEAGSATNQTTNGNTTAVEFLSIRYAQSGSISQVNATTYKLKKFIV